MPFGIGTALAVGAGVSAVGRQALVVKQGLAERAFRLRIRIGHRERDRSGPPEFLLQRREIVTLCGGRNTSDNGSA